MDSPIYSFESFKNACEYKENVMIWKHALSDAREAFGLYPERKLLNFINNNGLENLRFQNSNELMKNPYKEKPLHVDAYQFTSGFKQGYIAFFFMHTKNLWFIKSFKLSEDTDMLSVVGFVRLGR